MSWVEGHLSPGLFSPHLSFHSFSVDEKNVGKYNPRKLLRRQDTPRIVESDPVIQVDIWYFKKHIKGI